MAVQGAVVASPQVVPSVGPPDSLPTDDLSSQEPLRKRRRPGRKRKRRPQQGQQANNLESQTEWQPDQTESYSESYQPPQDNVINKSGGIFAHADVQSQVVRVQGVNEPSGRARIRESIQATNENVPDQHEESSTRSGNKSYRRPYSVAKKEEVQTKQSNEPSSRAADIKNLLKQSGGLSLSEILQQQNLSLDDLLEGKQKALIALQNTAAPPEQAEAWEAVSTKSSRRIPALAKASVAPIPTREHDHPARRNITHRISNFQKPLQPTTLPVPVHEAQVSVEQQPTGSYLIPHKKMVSTIPTLFTYTTADSGVEVATISNSVDPNAVRRLPIHRTKPIKEVVSAIRPDLSNSGSRKRLPLFKSSLNKTVIAPLNTTSQTKLNAFEIPPKAKERPLPQRYLPGLNSALRLGNAANAKIETNNTISEEPTTSELPITTTGASTTSTSTENTRVNYRNRLALRPRLRTPGQLLSSTSTQPSVEVTSEEIVRSADTIQFTTSLPQTDDPNNEPNNESNDNLPDFDLNKKLNELNESAPELNIIELEAEHYQESKPKDTVSLEDLFLSDVQVKTTERADDQFIHSSTSRSYNVAASGENGIPRYSTKYSSSETSKRKHIDVTERNPSLFTDINTRLFDDKTELLDLLEDRRSGSRLVKVLQQRNMTLEELIEHRKRGSSQLHLSEIFLNRSQPDIPDSSEELGDKLDIVTAFENFPKFNLDNLKSIKPDEIKTDSQGSSYFTSIINIKPTSEIFKEGRSVREPPMMINLASAMSGQGRNIPNTPWGSSSNDYDSDKDLSGEDDDNYLDGDKITKVTVIAPRRSPPPESFHDIDEIENEASRSHDLLDLELSGHGFKRNSVTIETAQLPMGVRSAIIASSSIVGISLAIFIVIFVTCRWRQQRRKKVTYSDRFQAIRGRLPILNSRDVSPSKRGTSPPIFLYGSRRNSKLNTMDPNSPEVQEYLYEAMRKPFQ